MTRDTSAPSREFEAAHLEFAAAVDRFDAVHREDPNQQALAYHRRLERWVTTLSPEPSVALRLAANCQHIRRWGLPRAAFPLGLAGYKRWRTTLAQRHADEAQTILREVGFDDEVIDRVGRLLLKRGLGSEPEVQLFEDAICLAFIEGELAAFATLHDESKLLRILRKTWKKMSPQGHAAATELAQSLDAETQALLGRALS